MTDTVFADAYTEKKKGDTMRTALEEPLSDALMRITGALDQGSGWLRMIDQLGLRGRKGVTARVAQLKDDWLRGKSPSRAILRSLVLSAEFAELPTMVFMNMLLEQHDPVLDAEVMRWAQLSVGRTSLEQAKRAQRDIDETTMIDFFLHNQIASSTDEAIEYCRTLAQPKVRVDSLHKLGFMSKCDLIAAGIASGPAAMIVHMLTPQESFEEQEVVAAPPPAPAHAGAGTPRACTPCTSGGPCRHCRAN